MWFIGHIAFAYVIVKCLVLGKRFRPDFLILLFFFSNLIDFVHFGWTRVLSHNLFAGILIPVVFLLALYKPLKISRKNSILLFIAGVSHMMADTLFGTFSWLFPFSIYEFSLIPFNISADLITESVLALVFISFLFLSGEAKSITSKPLGHPAYKWIMAALFVMFIVQLVGYVWINLAFMLDWYVPLLFVLMVVFVSWFGIALKKQL